jgi:hypothetical protein
VLQNAPLWESPDVNGTVVVVNIKRQTLKQRYRITNSNLCGKSDIAILRETLFGSWDRVSPPNDSTDATAMLKSSID